MEQTQQRMPVIYMPHGGGPWPFVELAFMSSSEVTELKDYLAAIPAALPARPKAMVVVSAHWEAKAPTVMTSAKPPLFYDYFGFPPESYRITWPAPGSPELAAHVRHVLGDAGIQTAEDDKRGFDHGTFVPLKVSFPEADVPTVQLSLHEGLDPAFHLAMGRALAPLRDEGILIVGSGMSFHNMRAFGRKELLGSSVTFDAWLRKIAEEEPAARDADLTRWAEAPSARQAHPREEHLLPLMVAAGAAGADRGRVAFSGTFAQARISAVHFGVS